MGDEGDFWRDVKPAMIERSKKKRASNREQSAEFLRVRGVQFESKNDGAHLIVQGKEEVIDFWPGTGYFKTRSGSKGRGVRNLIKRCRRNEQ